jgi:hypothetical protein
MAKVQKWEYCTLDYWRGEEVTFHTAEGERKQRYFGDALASLGQDGWEAVAVVGEGCYLLLFKRPIQSA